MSDYIDEKTLEDGSVLLFLKHRFVKNPTQANMISILSCLRDSKVFVPMTEEMKPTSIQDGEYYYLPIFSNEEQIPEKYGSQFAVIKISVLECLSMAKSYENIYGLILDPFTEKVILVYALADMIPKISSKLAPKE